MDKVFIDSCIVIDFIKGNSIVENDLVKISKPCINFIVALELIQGARNKHELTMIKKKLKMFWMLPMHNEIANLTFQLIDLFSLSHSLQIPDGIIASTVLIYDMPLYTNNLKDFRYIPNLKLYDKK